MSNEQKSDEVREKVREGYAEIAERGSWRRSKADDKGCCCGSGPDAQGVAVSVGYEEEELASLPEGANLGVCCGNPAAIADLREGEIVLDLGSGAGFDAFIAGPKVGQPGRVIGVDMTPEMLAKARASLASYQRESGLDNVEFRLGEIEHLPVADASVDVVISNCVLNLSPDKPQVWREIARVLRPGGRVAVSDLALLRPLPEAVREMPEVLIGCIGGAILTEDYKCIVEEAGLSQVAIKLKPDYVRAMVEFQDPLYVRVAEGLPAGSTPADYVTSIDVTASH